MNRAKLTTTVTDAAKPEGKLLSAEELAEIQDNVAMQSIFGAGDMRRLLDHITALTKERDDAYGYLSRLFVALAPQCTPLPYLLGVCTQIDNWSVGAKEKEAELARIRGRLTVEGVGGVLFYSERIEDEATVNKAAKAIIDHITKE
jgi:hypothetical protein